MSPASEPVAQATFTPMAYLTTDGEAIRRSLEAYRQLAAELPELMRAARRPEVDIPIAEIARLAGVDRGRVHRAIRVEPEAAADVPHRRGCILPSRHRGECSLAARRAECDNVTLAFIDERFRYGWDLGQRRLGPILRDGVDVGWLLLHGMTTGAGAFEARTADVQARGDSEQEALQALAERIANAEQ